MLSLSISRADELVAVACFCDGIVKVGALPSCHIELDDDVAVSPLHALIELSAATKIIDLGSATGTRVNGESVRSQVPLRGGDRIRVGSYELELFCVDPRRASEVSVWASARERAHVALRHGERAAGEGRLEACADAIVLAAAHCSDPELPEVLGDLREVLGVPRAPLAPDTPPPWLDGPGLACLDRLRRALVPSMLEAGPAFRARCLELEVLLAPESASPRRVYADWLLECGDPRGEFIALQLADAEGQLDGRGRAALAQLWAEHGPAWSADFVALGAEVRFARGFPSEVRYDGPRPEALSALVRRWRTIVE